MTERYTAYAQNWTRANTDAAAGYSLHMSKDDAEKFSSEKDFELSAPGGVFAVIITKNLYQILQQARHTGKSGIHYAHAEHVAPGSQILA